MIIDYDDIEDLEFDGINHSDYPDYCDAYITAARYKRSGKPLDDTELDALNDDSDFIYEALQKYLY